MEEEVFIPISGYEHQYMISNKGTVKSIDRIIYRKNRRLNKNIIISLTEKNLKPQGKGKDYLYVRLYNDNCSYKDMYVHRLVALHFVSGWSQDKMVNHKDGDRKNNHCTNLEWVTSSENVLHGIRRRKMLASICT